ncbi:MAG TPA: ABC transporter ATP-binding protein [Anaerolineae bacterium]|nr:ABC transporter ATP-binding protein [Anaerolineae bacterium]
MIKTTDLTRRFGTTTAVDNLSLTVNSGEIYGLVGPDGAGKTTTFRLLVGALLPDAGSATIASYDLLTQIDHIRQQIGYLPQRFSLYGDLTVAENLRFFAELNGTPAKEWQPRRDEMLKFVNLAEFAHRRADQLSGGMKQKLGLATALIHRPRLLLLDEPTGGVDPITRQDFWHLITQVVINEGVTVLISTPYMDEASRCHRVGFIHNGRLLTVGSPQTLMNQLNGRLLKLVGSPRQPLRQLAAQDPDVLDVQAFGAKLHLRLRPNTANTVIPRLTQTITAAGLTLTQLEPIEPTLEDFFIHLLSEQPS